jgi:pilus assembly protein CpaB
MKVKTWVPLVVAVVLGLIAAKLTRDVMAKRHGQAAPVQLSAVVTAAADIQPGQPLSAAVLTTGQMTSGSVPVGAFESPDALADRVAITRLVKGQPVLESMLAPVGDAAGVQALIPPGMRAITVEVTEFSGLRGLLAPGCRVDVISVVPVGDGTQNSIARTIVQNVEVRAVGLQITSNAGGAAPGADAAAQPSSVTLLVTPAQAEAVQLASSGGRPWLVLRNARDAAPFDTAGTSLADLRGEAAGRPGTELVEAVKPQPEPRPQPEPAKTVDVFEETPVVPPAPPAPRTRAVTFIKGTKEEVVQVALPPEASPETVTSNDNQDATGAK